MKLSDQLIHNYKKYMNGEPHTVNMQRAIYLKHFVEPCMNRLQRKIVPGVKPKFIVRELKRIRTHADYASERIPYLEQGWWVNHCITTFQSSPDLLHWINQAGYFS